MQLLYVAAAIPNNGEMDERARIDRVQPEPDVEATLGQTLYAKTENFESSLRVSYESIETSSEIDLRCMIEALEAVIEASAKPEVWNLFEASAEEILAPLERVHVRGTYERRVHEMQQLIDAMEKKIAELDSPKPAAQ